MAKSKTLTINTEKPKASYSLKGITNIKLVSDNNIFGNNDLADMITSVQISGKYLLVTMNTDEGEGTLKFTDYYNIANMTMQYSNINKEKGELYQVLSDKLNYNVTDTTKSSLSGTIFDDVINLADAQYVPIGKKNIKNNTGVTINTGTGNDTITGTKYNDTITGGADINTINIDVTKNFGNDTYKLTNLNSDLNCNTL